MNKFAIALAAATISFTAVANAEDINYTGEGTASAKVIKPLSVDQSEGLNFGTFAPSKTIAGSVAVDNADALTTSGVDMVAGSGAAAGKFDIDGEASQAYTVSIPASVSLASGESAPMIATLTLDGNASRSLDGSGTGEVIVVGSLAVAANQAVGDYSGTYDVTVSYN